MGAIDPKTCLVTGATSGLGQALVLALAQQGWSVAMLARDRARGEAAVAAVRQAGAPQAEVLFGDLASLSSVRQAAADLGRRLERLDLLINCASVYLSSRHVSPDGLEMMFATNHLGPFLLTDLLSGPLRAADSARVLTIAAPSTVRPDFSDLQGTRRFRSLQAFGATKMANLLFTFALARRLEGSTVTANAVHPGVFRSGLMRQAPAPMRWITSLMGTSPQKAAEPVLRVATDPAFEGQNGRFFHKAEAIDPPAYSLDVSAQEHLWQESLHLAGLEA